MAPVVAAIDCGTNSIRLLVATAGPDGRMQELDRRLELNRLGQGVDATGEFHPDALRRTWQALDRYAARIRELGATRVRLVATSAARDVRNRQAFFDGVRERLGVEVDVIPGNEEARLSFTGALTGVAVAAEPVLVIDIGGGSTELILGGRDGSIQHAVSLDVGSVRLRERFLHHDVPTPGEVAAARAHVEGLLDGSGTDLDSVATFIGVAGTATSLSAISQGLQTYQREAVHGSVLAPKELQRLADELLATPAEVIQATTCLPRKRAEVVCAGALVNAAIARRVRQPMVVSESDILDALALELLAQH